MKQFVAFCHMFEPEKELTFDWFLSPTRIQLFLRFMDKTHAANTTANHAKTFSLVCCD